MVLSLACLRPKKIILPRVVLVFTQASFQATGSGNMTSAPSYMLVGVGQCGTQIASDVHEAVWAFSPGLSCCTLVDSEAKSIQSKSSSRGAQTPINVIASDACGRGNNWAHGFAGSVFEDGNTLGSAAVDSIRRSLEALQTTPSVLLCHAWGGGTGSGVGSFLLEHLRDEVLPSHGSLMSLGVCPFQSGGSPLQSINTVLTAATAMEHCCATLVQYNDEVLQAVQQAPPPRTPPHNSAAGGAGGGARSSAGRASAPTSHMQDMNHIIAERVSFLLPPQHVGCQTMSGMPALLAGAARPAALYHLSAASVPSEQLSQRTPLASLLSSITAQVHTSRRVIASFEGPAGGASAASSTPGGGGGQSCCAAPSALLLTQWLLPGRSGRDLLLRNPLQPHPLGVTMMMAARAVTGSSPQALAPPCNKHTRVFRMKQAKLAWCRCVWMTRGVPCRRVQWLWIPPGPVARRCGDMQPLRRRRPVSGHTCTCWSRMVWRQTLCSSRVSLCSRGAAQSRPQLHRTAAALQAAQRVETVGKHEAYF